MSSFCWNAELEAVSSSSSSESASWDMASAICTWALLRYALYSEFEGKEFLD